MPGFDRSGPWGQGPRTGGGFGLCGRRVQPEENAEAIEPAAPLDNNQGRINRRTRLQAAGQGAGQVGAGWRGGMGRGRGRRGRRNGGGFGGNQPL